VQLTLMSGQTAWDGIEQAIDLLQEKRIKVVINGGAHNPKGLAEKVQELVSDSLFHETDFCYVKC
jgi:ribonucleotide monophosphatase NagD (HAD superfamily)